ncbi:MAG: NupC/NupG family nucleoside CNT transporter [Planctomycetota bacterium]
MIGIAQRLTGLIGIAVLLGLAIATSRDRRRIPWRTVAWGLGLQAGFAVLILKTAPGRAVFQAAAAVFRQIIAFTEAGTSFLFGDMATEYNAFRMLPVLIFFASLMGVLYHLGVMQKVVAGMAWLMRRTMGLSGAEALSASGNVFVGMTEAPLLIRPYVASLTESELMAVMTGGLATVAGSVMAAYVGMLKGESGGHLLCASVMSAPAAVVIAKIMIPETEAPQTAGAVEVSHERTTRNVIDAAAAGAGDGLRLALNVGAMLIAFLALIAMVNFGLGWGHDLAERWLGFAYFPSSLQEIFGVVLRPLAWVMGVPWRDADAVGSLMGIKIAANEWIAYARLAKLQAELAPKSKTIAMYALCGFANFGSIGILLGGIGGLAPQRRGDLARLSLRALAGGAMASFLTACIAGILL